MSTVSQAVAGPELKKIAHFGYIDGLRGMAALYVVLHHFCLWGAPGLPRWATLLFGWTLYGHFAVAVFITLSGFCLMLPVVSSPGQRVRGGFVNFMKARARRILPPYYAAVAIGFLIAVVSPQGFAWLRNDFHSDDKLWLANFTTGNLLSHLLVLHNLTKEWSGKFAMALWSISTEWEIYFFFPLLLLPIWRRFGNVLTIVVGFTVGLLPHMFLPAEKNFDWACPWYLGLFALGMASAAIATSESRGKAHIFYLPWVTLIAGVAYVCTKFLQSNSAPGGDDALFWIKDAMAGAIAASAILYCAIVASEGKSNLILRLFENRIVVGLGAWSYSLYLTHCLVLQIMQLVQREFQLPSLTALALRVFIGLPLALVFAYVFFLVFERPFLKSRSRAGSVGKKCIDTEITRSAATTPSP